MNAAVELDHRDVEASGAPRAIVLRTHGTTHGAITRLVSPSDIGELIKPFVFLDLFAADPANAPRFGWHPHSGIATCTVIFQGEVAYEETTGVKGTLGAGEVEWMRAGGGVWHTGSPSGTQPTKGFQLWVALPPDLENGSSESRYLSADEVDRDGPARVVLGSHGTVRSPILAPAGINYLDVRLSAGEQWTYQPPAGHSVAWIAVHDGRLYAPELVSTGELVVFEDSHRAITFNAVESAGFVLGSAVKHPHELVLGHYSVHTQASALRAGEAEIQRIGRELMSAGILR
jgi:redox-sensitive bicupin YhaK (pirin superfamily)